ncbi:hypothetical protein ZEAMMB73_Zm00001d018338 [Zea mays]|uniref:Uncharacterized protein n=1 Tax=Zea mays TaxID=4577 RepID=A0A1D6HMV7_MAIZE|nr:hypothetical protein ZEAMMB73_Zm00001d018338 [Zea mays]
MEHGYHLGLRHNMLITRRLSQVTRINKGNLLCRMFCIRCLFILLAFISNFKMHSTNKITICMSTWLTLLLPMIEEMYSCYRENGCPQEKCRTLCIKGINKMLMG